MSQALQHFFQVFVDGITYDLFKHWFLAAIMTGAAQLVLRYAFNKLKKRREIVAFWIGSFVLILGLIYSLGSHEQQPNLVGGVQQVLAGPTATDRDTIAVLSLHIVNIGTMQTIARNWKVEAEASGAKYDAIFVQMPSTFIFNKLPRTSPVQPESVSFSSGDNIIEKSLTPIQVGALLPGVLFVMFQNVDQSVFKGVVTYTVSFEDVLSKRYSTSIKSSGRADTVGIVPGIHQQATCPIPPGGLPKLDDGNLLTGTSTK
jgi:hypothetical protein